LGTRQFLGILVTFGGVLLSVLVYPIALLAMGLTWWLGGFGGAALTGIGSWLWLIALINLSTGILAPMVAAALAVLRRGRPRLLLSVLWMPVYWVLISLAGYRALVDLARRPHYWEKTRHGLSGRHGFSSPRHASSAGRHVRRISPSR
jgi:hypothetical protein